MFKVINSRHHRQGVRPTATLVMLGLVVIPLVACRPSAERPTRTAVFVPTIPLTSTIRSATLPPTWTPSPSPIPSQTPSPTLSPTPAVTPSPTMTLSAQALCQQFQVLAQPEQGASVAYGGVIGFAWQNAPSDSQLVLSLVDSAGLETLFTLPPDLGFNAEIGLLNLPTWGDYRWRLSLFSEPYGELCPVEGAFFREPWWSRPIENPLNPPFSR